MDFKKIEKKWQKKWENEKIFEAEPDKREKFFVNVPYPYTNGYGHLGHMLTYLRGDIIARYKRMKNYNVLFTQGWHITGQPIVAAAKRIKEGEKKQIEMLKKIGFSKKEIEKFSDPIEWVKYFPNKWIEDFKNLGYSIDWRRSFVTTYLNKPYDSFVKWQFKKLKEKGLVKKGEHPVVYCEKCDFPIGDHDRIEGEGVVPEEVILIKFKLDEETYVPVVTYRPETVYGVTNIWIHPKGNYVKVKVNGKEKWIVSKEILKDLENQNFEIKELEEVKGKNLIGKKAKNLVNDKKVPILPATIVDTKMGTGIVMSVPAHAPFDEIGIKELKENESLRKKYGLKEEDLNFDYISLMKIEGYEKFPAAEINEKMGIKSSKEKKKLEEATQEIYKKEFHNGVLKISGFEGKKVQEVKDEVIEKFLKEGVGIKYYILSEKVVCRCLTEAKVKIVSDQWFLNYSDKEWKKKSHKVIESMNFYPKKIKENFHYTVDWLKDWACSRDKRTGLGTALPFDETQMIESLSDSTIYMAYYTIANYLQERKLRSNKKLNDKFFDYVFFGKGDNKKVAEENGFDSKTLEKIREEFLYWYDKGFELRNSGKDLIQNHLTFCIFNHAAIFPEKKWPGGFSTNGHVLLDGEKMSKSKGNVVLMKEAIKDYPVDVIRFLGAYSGDSGLDDANIELREHKAIQRRLKNFYNFAVSNYNKGGKEYTNSERWLESVLNRVLKTTEKELEGLNTKSALQHGFFDLQNAIKWYRKRSVEFNKELIKKFIETQLKILAPVTPFLCEELWEKIGGKNFISLEQWPESEKKKIDQRAEVIEKVISNLLEDIEIVKKLSKTERPNKIKIITPKKWKYNMFSELKNKLEETRNFGDLMKVAMGFEEAKKISKEIQKVIKKILDGSLGIFDLKEVEVIKEEKDFLKKEFGCEVEIVESDEKDSWPGKFGILVK